MKNKFINLLFQEPGFSLKLSAVILLVIFSLFLTKAKVLKRAEIIRLTQDQAKAGELKIQIPALEERLKALEVKTEATVVLKPQVNLVLKGVLTLDGESAAIINNDIYQKGDTVSGLIITAITANTVTLQDPITAEQTKIQLPE